MTPAGRQAGRASGTSMNEVLAKERKSEERVTEKGIIEPNDQRVVSGQYEAIAPGIAREPSNIRQASTAVVRPMSHHPPHRVVSCGPRSISSHAI